MMTTIVTRVAEQNGIGGNSDPTRSRAGQAHDLRDFHLAEWLVQPSLDRLTHDGVVVRIRPQLMDLLVCLAAQPGKTVTREQLLATVWCGRFIAESVLSRCVAELRHALGDSARQPRIIETIHKRGYRLIAPVVVLEPAPLQAVRRLDIVAGNRSIARSDVAGACPPDVAPRPPWFHGAMSRLRVLLIGLAAHMWRGSPGPSRGSVSTGTDAQASGTRAL
jgi:DNA-binding winged helix-turn-helix (wHTH) protein